MKNLSKSGILLTLVPIFLIIFLVIGCSMKSTRLKKDEDIVILRHLKYYGELFEEYHEVAGKYPSQEIMPVPLYVYVANDKQMDFVDKEHRTPYADGPFGLFIKQIESVLGRPVSEYYDPVDQPVSKPNYYVYRIHHDTFYFTVYVHYPYSFARRIARNYYEVIISNKANPKNQIHTPHELLNSEDFNNLINKAVSKNSFFKEREEKYLHYTKAKNTKAVPFPEEDIL